MAGPSGETDTVTTVSRPDAAKTAAKKEARRPEDANRLRLFEDEVERTKRYQLAERLSEQCDSLLLLTATPHHGDDDRFAHFIRLLDRDLFPEPHRLGEAAGRIRRDILKLGEDCPWSLRRLKEDLKDMRGRRLFPDRHVQTVSFELGPEEYTIYKAVTAYINEFLPQATGRRKNSVALARTVFQRRLASSTHAIHESLRRRQKKLDDLLRELEGLPPAQRARRLAQLQGRLSDTEQDEDDLDEAARDLLIDEATTAAELDQLRAELAELGDLVARVGRVRESGRDSKLVALRECVQRSEFEELKDGRGKLLLFTEHRDTLNYLREHLEAWGYSTCQIHGGMNPRERKQAQEDFRTSRQICVATEAAGEGINLQFCHLMINYDLSWNPTRLEQRLGRIHRIGQMRDVYAFNFVATSSEDGQPVIEGRILERLLGKLDRMREALGDRVFDVVGEVLSLNRVNLPDMLRVDSHKCDRQQFENIYKKKLLKKRKVLTYADFTAGGSADVEDLFSADFYLRLVNDEFGCAIQSADLSSGHPRILRRLEEYLRENPLPQKARFNHYRPARYFSSNIETLVKHLGDEELVRFERAFRAVNALLWRETPLVNGHRETMLVMKMCQ